METGSGALSRGRIRPFASLSDGVARDEAFSFYYPTSLQVLEQLGAELVPFSPLHDQELPSVDGLIIGGGFPEMFAGQLSANQSMRDHQSCAAAGQGMPIYARVRRLYVSYGSIGRF